MIFHVRYLYYFFFIKAEKEGYSSNRIQSWSRRCFFRSFPCVLTSNLPWQKCSFALSPRFHRVFLHPVLSSSLLSLPFACPYKAPLRLVSLVPLLTAVCPPRFFFAFLLVVFMSVWNIAYISHTYNYEDACRITGRSAVALWTTQCKKTRDATSVVASYSIDKMRLNCWLNHRVNQQRELRKKQLRIGYNS